jgi:hypothetical protein
VAKSVCDTSESADSRGLSIWHYGNGCLCNGVHDFLEARSGFYLRTDIEPIGLLQRYEEFVTILEIPMDGSEQ